MNIKYLSNIARQQVGLCRSRLFHSGKLAMSHHPPFKDVEGGRSNWVDHNWEWSKIKKPDWKPGQGANDDSWKSKSSIQIDPYQEGRAAVDNYKLLISGVVPRPIGFVGTLSADGKSTNLAPFSYTQVMTHDLTCQPPVFVVGFASSLAKAKDTLRNLVDSKECTINIVSEHFMEAANYCSIDAPDGVSEWSMSGLTKGECNKVRAPRVLESVFSIEGKLMNTQEFTSPATGKITGCMAVIQGVNFHIREDAINEQKNYINVDVLRPIARLGGITYSRVNQGFEVPRPVYEQEIQDPETKKLTSPL